MTGTDIKTQAELYLDYTIDDDNFVTIINRALNIIGDKAMKIAEIEISEPTEDTWYDLPDDLTYIIRVVNEDGNIFTKWEYFNNQIRLNTEDYCKIYCRKIPDDISAKGDAIGIHDLYQEPLIDYVVSFIKLMKNDTSEDGHKLDKEFRQEVARVYNQLQRNKQPSKVNVIRHA